MFASIFFVIHTSYAELDTYTTKSSILFYHGDNIFKFQPYKVNRSKDILAHPDFDDTKETLLYINDCFEMNNESINIIVDAYIRKGGYNILALEWSSFSKNDFFNVLLPNLNLLSSNLAENIIKMIYSGLKVNKFHIVGFGLGAQLAGLTGREIKNKTNGLIQITRITGLDPTTNGFYTPTLHANSLKGLCESDAGFVDVIHTDSGFHGTSVSSGTADFWPNYGHRYQPGCLLANVYNPLLQQNDLCSHKRAYILWAESVTALDNTTFLSAAAANFESFRRGILNLSRIALMGIDCSLSTERGNYYLQTNAVSPFSRGVTGLSHMGDLYY